MKLPWSGTFHSIAKRLIRRHAASVGLDANFSVFDRGDAADLMDVVRHELDLSRSEKRFPRKDTCLAIYSHRVNTRGTLADTLGHVFPWCAAWEEELTRLFRAYVERKLAHQALDYDDLLLYWHAMAADPALAADMGAQFDQILVDEYQDTNCTAGGNPQGAAAFRRGCHGGGGRCPVYLLVSRRDGGEHPRLSGAVRAAGECRDPRG